MTAVAPARSSDDAERSARYELRTLLNEIIGYSELLIEEAQDWGHQGLAEDLAKIRAAGQRMLSLDVQLLAAPASASARPDAPAPAPEPRPPRGRPPVQPIEELVAVVEQTPVRVDLDYGVLLKLGGAVALVWFLGRAWSVVVLVAVALMLVATISPLLRRMEARFHRRLGIALVTVGVVGAAAGLMGILIPPLVRQVQSLMTNFPRHAQTIEALLIKWKVPFSLASTQGWTRDAAPQVITAASTMLSGVVELVMVAVLTIYLLIDGPGVTSSLIRLFPRGERLAVRRVLGTIADRVGSYMRGQLLTSALAGVLSFLLLIVCRVPEPLALAVWMAMADAIPLVGLLVGGVPAVLLALTQGGHTALIVGAGYVVYHQIETTVLVPRLYSTTMKLSGSAILISILIGGKLMGVVGALLALPVAAVLPVVVRYVGQWRDRQADRRRGGSARRPAADEDSADPAQANYTESP